MPDEVVLNDPELEDLERRLAGIVLSPPCAQRDQLVFLSGQAAGRAEMRRHVRRLYAVVATLGSTVAGLAGYLWMPVGPTPSITVESGSHLQDARLNRDSRSPAPPSGLVSGASDSPRQFMAHMSYEQLVEWDQNARTPATSNGNESVEVERVLTPLGPFRIDEMWN